MRVWNFGLICLFLLAFVGFAFADGLIASAVVLEPKGDQLAYGSLIVTPIAELAGKMESLDRNSKTLVAYTAVNDVTKTKEGEFKFGLTVQKDTSIPSGIGWLFESKDLLIEDWNEQTTIVNFGYYLIDFQDVKDAGLGLKFVKTVNGVAVYAVGDFKGELIFIDPVLRSLNAGSVNPLYKGTRDLWSKFVIRVPDTNKLYAHLGDGNIFYVTSGGTTASVNPVSATMKLSLTTMTGSFMKTDNNKLVYVYQPEPSTTDQYVSTCNLNTFTCLSSLHWGTPSKVFMTNDNKSDTNGTNIFIWDYNNNGYWTGVYSCDATIKDCNVTTDYSFLAAPLPNFDSNDGGALAADKNRVWVTTGNGQTAYYNTVTRAWSSKVTIAGYVISQVSAGIAANQNLIVARTNTNDLDIKEFNGTPALARVQTITKAGLTVYSTITMTDKNIFVLFDVNEGGGDNLYYVTRGFNDTNFSQPQFIQSNCLQPSSSKKGANQMIDYTCYNLLNARIDLNYLSYVYTPPTTADFTITYKNGAYLDPELGKNTALVDFNDSSFVSPGTTITDWNWYSNGVLFSTDQNTTKTFTAIGDYNIKLSIEDSTGIAFNITKVVSIINVTQGLSVILDGNTIVSGDSNISYTVKASWTSGTPQHFWWTNWGIHFGGDTNYLNAISSTNGDYNYCVIISISDINKQSCLDIFITKIIVKIPLDESDLNIIKPYNLSMDTNTGSGYTNLTTDINVWIVSLNIPLVKNLFVVDSIGEYVGRYYGLVANANVQTLQPYLLSLGDASAVKFIVNNELNEPISNVIFNISKAIGGSKTLISTSITDTTGISLLFLKPGDTYYVDMNYNGQLVFSTSNFVFSTSPVYFYINTLTNYGNITPSSIINVSFNPFVEFIQSGISNIKIDINGSNANYAILKFYKFPDCNIYVDKNYFQVTSKACVGNCNFTIPVNTIHYDSNCQFYAEVTVFSDNNTSQRVWTKRYSKFVSALNPINLFVNARKDFGCSTDVNLPCPLTSIASILLILLAIGAIAFKFGFSNPTGLGVLALMGLAFFTYVGWFYWIAFSLIAIVLVIGLIGKGGE